MHALSHYRNKKEDKHRDKFHDSVNTALCASAGTSQLFTDTRTGAQQAPQRRELLFGFPDSSFFRIDLLDINAPLAKRTPYHQWQHFRPLGTCTNSEIRVTGMHCSFPYQQKDAPKCELAQTRKHLVSTGITSKPLNRHRKQAKEACKLHLPYHKLSIRVCQNVLRIMGQVTITHEATKGNTHFAHGHPSKFPRVEHRTREAAEEQRKRSPVQRWNAMLTVLPFVFHCG